MKRDDEPTFPLPMFSFRLNYSPFTFSTYVPLPIACLAALLLWLGSRRIIEGFGGGRPPGTFAFSATIAGAALLAAAAWIYRWTLRGMAPSGRAGVFAAWYSAMTILWASTIAIGVADHGGRARWTGSEMLFVSIFLILTIYSLWAATLWWRYSIRSHD